MIYNRFLFFRFCSFFFLFLWFSILFFWGGESAPDRVNYLVFFDNPTSSRFEPLFKEWGEFLLRFNIDSFFSMYLTASLGFLFSFFVCSSLFKDQTSFFVFFGFVFFAFLSVYGFIQIRASVALWSGMFLFLKYIESRNGFFLVILLFEPLVHFMMAPFVLAVIYFSIFKRAGFFEVFFVFIFLLFIVSLSEWLVGMIPYGEYYAQYFSGVLVNKIWLSFTVLFYFLMVFFVVYSSVFFNVALGELERFSFMGFPLVVIGYFTGVDLFVKFAAPFMFLLAVFFFRRLFFTKRDAGNEFISALLSVFLGLGVLYPLFKYI